MTMSEMNSKLDMETTKKIVAMKRLYETLRMEMQEKFQRDLPLVELLFDRWERAESLGFGKGTSVYHDSYVY